MNDRIAADLTPFVRRDVDARGVVTLTLNRPQSFNALSEGMLAALQAELDAVAADETRARRRHRRDRQGLLRRPRPEGDARRAVAGVLRAPVRAVRAHDADDPAPAGAGDRARAGHRHRGRLPARRAVRSRRRRRQRALRGERRQPRPVLLVAERARCRATSPRKPAFEMLVTGEFISRRRGARTGLVNRVAAPEALDAEVESLVAAIVAKPRVGDRARQAALLPPDRERRRGGVRRRGQDDGLQHDGRRRARGRAGLHRQAQARPGRARA